VSKLSPFLLAVGLLTAHASSAEVIITEIMQDPAAVSDGDGEWFEVYNSGGSSVDLNGWTIADNDADSHTISTSVVIPAASYAVLCRNSNSALNGGVPSCAYQYGSAIALANGADEIVLLDGSMVEIDRVEYDGGITFPDPTGASMELIGDPPTVDNNVGINWGETPGTTTYGDGDAGSPGEQNPGFPVELQSFSVE
jgi:hypothetical protein